MKHPNALILGAKATVMAAAILAVAGTTQPASAHTPAADIGCHEGLPYVTGDFTKYQEGATVRIRVDGALVLDHDFTGDYHVTRRIGSGYVGHDVTVRVVATDDADGSLGYTRTFRLSSPPCKGREHVADPSASISRACGDPMIRWTLRSGSQAQVFTINAVLFRAGHHTWTIDVPAHGTRVSSYHHLLGGSPVTIRSGGKVLASKTVEPAGTYPACPR